MRPGSKKRVTRIDYIEERRHNRRRRRVSEAAENDKNMVFRPATITDFEQGKALLAATANDLRSRGIAQWQQWIDPEPPFLAWLKDGFAQGAYFFVEVESQTVGLFRLSYEDELYWGKMSDQAAYVHSLLVLPDFQGQNMGGRILQKIGQMVRQKGILILRLDCAANNSPLCAYYERQGFKPVRLQEMPQYTVQLFEKILLY